MNSTDRGYRKTLHAMVSGRRPWNQNVASSCLCDLWGSGEAKLFVGDPEQVCSGKAEHTTKNHPRHAGQVHAQTSHLFKGSDRAGLGRLCLLAQLD